MRTGPAIHGALLIVALLLAYKTWTRDKTEEPKAGEYVIWSEQDGSFERLELRSESKDVVVESRKDDDGSYLWGKVTRTRQKVAKPKGPHEFPGHGAPPAPAAPDGAKPDGAKPDGAKPDGAKPGAAKPGAAKPAKPGAAKPAKPGAAKPVPAKPGAAKPVPAKPTAAKPSAASKPKPAAATPKPKPKAPAKSDGKKADQNDQIPPKSDKKPVKLQPTSPPVVPAKPAAGAAPGPAGPAPAATPADGSTPAPVDPHAGAHGAPAPPADPAPGEEETTVREFPVDSEAGSELAKNFTTLRAKRKLGVLDDEQKIEYGLDDATDRLIVRFKGGVEHKLVVGDRAFGGSDRYVLVESTGEGYVLASDVMKSLDAAETALALKVFSAFGDSADLHRLEVSLEGTKQGIVRLELEDDKAKVDPKAKTPPTRKTWARVESPTEEDVTMANFVDRSSKLRPVDYLPELQSSELTRLARFDFFNEDGGSLGYLELFKGPGETATPGAEVKDEYYMLTERTRVIGKVSRLTAERVDQDLIEVFAGTSTDDPVDPADPAP